MTIPELKEKLSKSVEFLKSELSQIRTGRANSALVEGVKVDAYGTLLSIKEIGTILVSDPQSIIVTPWDKSLVGAVAKAIRSGELNLNPVEDSDKVRIPIPPLTEERRKELVRVVSSRVEDAKNSIRNVRQDARKDVEKAFMEKEIGEDEKFAQMEKIEAVVHEFNSQIDSLGEAKKKEVLTI